MLPDQVYYLSHLVLLFLQLLLQKHALLLHILVLLVHLNLLRHALLLLRQLRPLASPEEGLEEQVQRLQLLQQYLHLVLESLVFPLGVLGQGGSVDLLDAGQTRLPRHLVPVLADQDLYLLLEAPLFALYVVDLQQEALVLVLLELELALSVQSALLGLRELVADCLQLLRTVVASVGLCLGKLAQLQLPNNRLLHLSLRF